MMKEGNYSPPTISPLLLRNLLTSIFIYAHKSLLNLGQKCKLLQFLRYSLLSAFIFFLRILPPLFFNFSHEKFNHNYLFQFPSKPDDDKASAFESYKGDSSIARALSQLLSIMNGIPVSSRKYEIVRSLAESLVDDNLREGHPVLREVNRTALSEAFSRTLSQLEARAKVMDEDVDHNGGVNGYTIDGAKRDYYKLSRVLRAVWYYGEAAWSRLGKSELNRCGKSAEKLSAELLWIAQKLAKSGSVEEAVHKWASASNLAWLALSAEPRLQGSILKVSVFLLKQAKEMGGNKEDEEKKEQERVAKMKLLMSWLPLLCRASNGTDTPVLTINEKTELEKILEDLIEGLGGEEEQEKVLSLWLHHFTHCPSSDWPNLHGCYARWCTASRRLLLSSSDELMKIDRAS